jgi:hypothetical protein
MPEWLLDIMDLLHVIALPLMLVFPAVVAIRVMYKAMDCMDAIIAYCGDEPESQEGLIATLEDDNMALAHHVEEAANVMEEASEVVPADHPMQRRMRRWLETYQSVAKS